MTKTSAPVELRICWRLVLWDGSRGYIMGAESAAKQIKEYGVAGRMMRVLRAEECTVDELAEGWGITEELAKRIRAQQPQAPRRRRWLSGGNWIYMLAGAGLTLAFVGIAYAIIGGGP